MIDPDAKAFIDLLNNVANMNRSPNLVELPPTPTRRDTANLTTQPRAQPMPTITKPQTPIRLECQPYIDEYRSNHLYLRERGIGLADYVRSAMRDEGESGNYELSTDLRELLDTIQLRAFGNVADPMRPLDPVV